MLEKIEKNLPKNSPANTLKNSYRRNPYTILMVTLLSLRSRDERTAQVAKKLFFDIQTPEELLKIPKEEIENIIKPIGFQKTKALTLINVSKTLIEKYNSKVPDDKKKLLSIKGVGEKTANIVLNSAFKKSVIAVDTHVNRVCNMWKIVNTKDCKKVSKILNESIPEKYKNRLNSTLVSFGQTICKVKNPKCEICPVKWSVIFKKFRFWGMGYPLFGLDNFPFLSE